MLKAIRNSNEATGNTIPAASHAHRKFCITSIYSNEQNFVRLVRILLRDVASRASSIPIEKHWAVVSDIFDPAPDGWGLRGDLYLWFEMSQVLCHVPLPAKPEDMAEIIASAYLTLMGETLDPRAETFVKRFARGGMSSGSVSGEFWAETFIPMMQRRADLINKIDR